MSNNNNQSTLKSNANAQTQSRREQYTTYVKEHNLETLISEMTNSVVHALSPNPILYMIKYLTGLLSEDDRTAYGINIPPPYPQGVPIVHYPKFKSKNMLSKHLTKHKWQDLKYIKTKYNNNINTLTKLNETCPSNAIGIALMDGDCLYCYDTLLTDIICDYHELPRTRELNADDSVDQSSDEDKAVNECKEYYKSGAFVTVSKDDLCFVETLARASRVRFEFARNVDGYSFNNSTKIRRAIFFLRHIVVSIKGGDFTVSYLGSVFYRMDDWHWPIFTHTNLAYPYGISVHGTDGSPLMSLIFKVFKAIP